MYLNKSFLKRKKRFSKELNKFYKKIVYKDFTLVCVELNFIKSSGHDGGGRLSASAYVIIFFRSNWLQ